jgi:predicted nucleic acid-binding protein
MIFVDSGAWLASLVRTDPDHDNATRWLDANRSTLMTSDYVVDETLTLMRARGCEAEALICGDWFFDSQRIPIVRVTDDDCVQAWQLFRDYRDKRWSFTDCTSKVVMQRLGITTAISFDHHFRQFGDISVVP